MCTAASVMRERWKPERIEEIESYGKLQCGHFRMNGSGHEWVPSEHPNSSCHIGCSKGMDNWPGISADAWNLGLQSFSMLCVCRWSNLWRRPWLLLSATSQWSGYSLKPQKSSYHQSVLAAFSLATGWLATVLCVTHHYMFLTPDWWVTTTTKFLLSLELLY